MNVLRKREFSVFGVCEYVVFGVYKCVREGIYRTPPGLVSKAGTPPPLD